MIIFKEIYTEFVRFKADYIKGQPNAPPTEILETFAHYYKKTKKLSQGQTKRIFKEFKISNYE